MSSNQGWEKNGHGLIYFRFRIDHTHYISVALSQDADL